MRRTRHRRRFHTDRIVAARRARYLRESFPWWDDDPSWLTAKLAYGRLASTDPWDCGNPRCGICHSFDVKARRAKETRRWRDDWGV